MKLEFGNLEHLLLLRQLRAEAIFVTSPMSWDNFFHGGDGEFLIEDADTLELKILYLECHNIRDEMSHKAGQGVLHFEFECVEVECFKPGFWYP